MKKNIYKGVPENFHTRLLHTLEQLDDTRERTYVLSRKYVLIFAAAILACASVTAAAVGLMEWHGRVSERFGTEKELEDRLTMEGAAVPQDAVIGEHGLKFRAIQAVRTDQYDYFLLQMTMPETLEWNEDILFEETQVTGPYDRCVANFVLDSLENYTVLLELQLYPKPEASDTGQVQVRLKNLVQTERSGVTECLVEGEWEIPLSVPSAEADTVTFYPEQVVLLGEHELQFTKVEVSPFQICLYADRELALHTVWGHSMLPAGVWYKDGTMTEENGIQLSMSGHSDETGAFCFRIPLEQAVDPKKAAGILLWDGTEERKLFLEPSKEEATAAANVPAELSAILEDRSLTDIRLLYVSYGNAVLSDGQSVYLWDALCGWGKELFSLEAYGFSPEDGGEITMGQANQILFLPFTGSQDAYLYDIAGQEMQKLDAETFWPWPTYESYMEKVKGITEVIPDADVHYSDQAFAMGDNVYYLYSESKTAEDMELRSVE